MTQSANDSAPWVPNDSTWGARLALIRQRMKWTNVAQAARECGIPADSWRNWEEGMEPRRLVTIAMAIATRTGVDVDWLVYGPNGKTVQVGQATSKYLSIDPLAPRVIAPVIHGDDRRRPNGRSGTGRTVASSTTSTGRRRYEPLPA